MKPLLLAVTVAVSFSSCTRDEIRPHSRQSTAMETYISVTTYDGNLSQHDAYALIDSAFAEIHRIEYLMTDYSESSDIGTINRLAGKDTVEVSDEVASLLRTSLSLSQQSAGAFDVSIGAIVRAWDFLSSEPEVPSRSKIRMLLRLTGFKNVMVDGSRVFLSQKGMRLDLGGIAKGYAVDRAVEILKRNGVKHAIVDIGGNLGVWWEGTTSVDSTVAEILVRHPRKEGKYFGSLKVGTAGVSTSGDYQRSFFHDGVRYHHIIDPATGHPARDVVSVTIIAGDALNADALSTLVFVLGREKGMDFIKHREDVEGIIVWEEEGDLYYELSPGLQGKFTRADD
ncbi:MAG: FAD:protein FMN transferase [Bacteroidetes bacterium]|nr:FAD:protein FMN transferase [Bacteroidota bacterium]MCW5894461.1 FAD:protein FMN transferase [Bacteroidota bacterium]